MIPVYTGVRAATWLLIITTLVGCASTIDSLPIVYKPELRQGTAITESAVEQLEAGMSPRQVRFVLGPPTIDDPFSEGRWDYLYEVDPRSSDLEPVSRRLTVHFDNEQVVAAEGSFIEDGHPLHNSR